MSVPHVQLESQLGQRKGRYRNILKKAAKAVERVYTDLVGLMKDASQEKSKHFVTVLDDFSRYLLVWFLFLQSEDGNAVVEMIQELETLFNSRVPTLITLNRN